MTDLSDPQIAALLFRTEAHRMIPLGGHPQQGQMVITGPQANRKPPLFRLGFCVQVRKGCGQFGSDMVFLRHADGSLTTHENQFFYAMSPEQEALARPLFKHLPEEEDYAPGYTCCDKVHEKGFLIAQSQSRPSPDVAVCAVVTHSTDAAGRPTLEHQVFLG